ncbi:MAG: rubrerythrin-like domain-containing protein [Halobacteriales archaeon]
MRPTPETETKELYECFDCGARIEAPQGRHCASCGGRLRHLGRSRDL